MSQNTDKDTVGGLFPTVGSSWPTKKHVNLYSFLRKNTFVLNFVTNSADQWNLKSSQETPTSSSNIVNFVADLTKLDSLTVPTYNGTYRRFNKKLPRVLFDKYYLPLLNMCFLSTFLCQNVYL